MVPESRRILILETSSRQGCAGLATGAGLVASAELQGEMRHAAELLPGVQQMLQRQGWTGDSLTDVFVSIGPGSFTGLRIGVSVARTLAWSVGARIVAVPSLEAIAREALQLSPPPAHVAVILDAKRGQVYAACFALEGGECRPVIDAHLAAPAEFFARCPRPLAVTGSGIVQHRPAVPPEAQVLDERFWNATAGSVLHIGHRKALAGEFTAAGDLIPLYIRRPEAEERWEQRQAASKSMP